MSSTLPSSTQLHPPEMGMARKFFILGSISVILSLYVVPEVFGSVAILLGAYTWRKEQGNRGISIVILGIICMIVGLYFTAYFTLYGLFYSLF
jgi:membrane-bound ClpP family serine protease